MMLATIEVLWDTPVEVFWTGFFCGGLASMLFAAFLTYLGRLERKGTEE